MYTNCRANSLLEWKIIVDQDAEDYLLQSVLKKKRWKYQELNTQESAQNKHNEPGTHHTTKSTHYTREHVDPIKMENRQHREDKTRIQEKTNQCHNSAQPQDEPREDQDELLTRLRKKLTEKAILDMVESQHLTMEEGKAELDGLCLLYTSPSPRDS